MKAINPIRILLFILLISISVPVYSQQKNTWEYNMLRRMADHRTASKNRFYTNISNYNNAVCLAPPAGLLIAGIISKNKLQTKKALYTIEAIATSKAITWLMKKTIGRDRPYINDTTFKSVFIVKGKSLPSGHTSQAFSMATAMTIAYPKWYVAVPAFSWACLVSYSRLYLGVHYPTDILAGAIVGSGSAWLMYKVNKWMLSGKRHKNNG